MRRQEVLTMPSFSPLSSLLERPNAAPDPRRRRLMLAASGACCLGWALPPRRAAAQSPDVARHLEAAAQAAGNDLLAYLKLGDPARPDYKPQKFSLDAMLSQPVPPPGKAFDNLYFVGSQWVSAWAIPTSDGIILVDALNNDDEAQRILEPGMRTLGLAPERIKTLVITHGHGDHYGGANYLKQRHQPHVVMSAGDWTMTETKLEFDFPAWGRPPKRDLAVSDGDTIKLGDTTLEVLVTPGHTLGTLSLIFPVRLGTQTHLALLWGGTAFNFGRQPERLRRYIAAVERVRDMARQRGVDVFTSNHNQYDEAIAKLAALRAGAAANPFVLGSATVQRALTVMSECAQANLAAWEA
jgi:metallo-beta-lactamase class B